jgi:hypothetical protein
MLAPKPLRTVGQLEVVREEGGYQVHGGLEPDLETGSTTEVIDRLKYEVISLLIQARPDLLWFHAGAAARQGRTILFPGGSGQGKSTLVTGLCDYGWTYLSDDVVPLDLCTGKVYPFPQTPRVREDSKLGMLQDPIRELYKSFVNLDPERVCREPTPVGALIFPTYDLGAPTELQPCAPSTATLEMLRNSVNFLDHRGAAVRGLCQLVTYLPTFHLSYSHSDMGIRLVAQSSEGWR